jgi:hypothetical protein
VKFISSDEIVLIGPGSEWFWTALQFVVVVVTLLAIYRQLRAQAASNWLHRMEALQGRWDSAQMVHARLAAALWRKRTDGGPPDFEAQVALNWLCGFFEDLGMLERQGYVAWDEVESGWGESLVQWWALLAPMIADFRSGTPGMSTAFGDFERLARRAEEAARRRGEDWSVPEGQIPVILDVRIGRDTARLRMLRDIAAGVIPTGGPVPLAAAPEAAQGQDPGHARG